MVCPENTSNVWSYTKQSVKQFSIYFQPTAYVVIPTSLYYPCMCIRLIYNDHIGIFDLIHRVVKRQFHSRNARSDESHSQFCETHIKIKTPADIHSGSISLYLIV